MDPKQRNATALHKRVDDLVKILLSEYTTMVGSAREDGDIDYSQSSQKELQIKENAMSIVTTAQNISMLIRDLQELWLFGSLDTLANATDQEVDRAKALEVARLVERLAKRKPASYKVPGEGSQKEGT